MRRLLALSALVLALGVAGCGGDDETTATVPTTGATGAQEPPAGGEQMTAGEFIDESIPGQIEAVTQAAAENPACADADLAPGSDFQVAVAIDAASVDPDTPLADIVADNC